MQIIETNFSSDLPEGAKRLLSPGESKQITFDNMKLLEARPGFTLWSIDVDDKTCNPYGMIHGGTLFMLADNCAGSTAATLGHKAVTLTSNMNFVKAQKYGKVYASPKIIHNGKSTLVIEVDIVNDDYEMVAKASFTMYSLGTIENF